MAQRAQQQGRGSGLVEVSDDGHVVRDELDDAGGRVEEVDEGQQAADRREDVLLAAHELGQGD